MIGISSTFIPNTAAISVNGNVTNDTSINAFIVSFWFVVRSESFVLRNSNNVSLLPSSWPRNFGIFAAHGF